MRTPSVIGGMRLEWTQVLYQLSTFLLTKHNTPKQTPGCLRTAFQGDDLQPVTLTRSKRQISFNKVIGNWKQIDLGWFPSYILNDNNHSQSKVIVLDSICFAKWINMFCRNGSVCCGAVVNDPSTSNLWDVLKSGEEDMECPQFLPHNRLTRTASPWFLPVLDMFWWGRRAEWACAQVRLSSASVSGGLDKSNVFLWWIGQVKPHKALNNQS